jgi:hypothetical protein
MKRTYDQQEPAVCVQNLRYVLGTRYTRMNGGQAEIEEPEYFKKFGDLPTPSSTVNNRIGIREGYPILVKTSVDRTKIPAFTDKK